MFRCVAAMLLTVAAPALAQDIEPRAFSNAPTGVNFLIGGYAFTRGGLSFDTAVPITDAQLNTSSAVLAYARELDLLGMSAKFDAITPYTWLSGTAKLAGQPLERTVDGLGDARFRLSVNFYGAPALTAQEFAAYQQDLILGASVQVSVPIGQYDSSRVINLGTNRWFVKPELGASKAIGPLTLELTTAATLYTANTNFFGGNTRSQDPIYSIHDDLQGNWRLGANLSYPLSSRYSVRLYASRGVSARTHNNYDLIGIALQYRWGGGL